VLRVAGQGVREQQNSGKGATEVAP